jgi:hypothetical protein
MYNVVKHIIYLLLTGVFNTTFSKQQYFSYIVAVSFIDGENRSTLRKPSTCRKSLTWQTLSHNVVLSTPHHEQGSAHNYSYSWNFLPSALQTRRSWWLFHHGFNNEIALFPLKRWSFRPVSCQSVFFHLSNLGALGIVAVIVKEIKTNRMTENH